MKIAEHRNMEPEKVLMRKTSVKWADHGAEKYQYNCIYSSNELFVMVMFLLIGTL